MRNTHERAPFLRGLAVATAILLGSAGLAGCTPGEEDTRSNHDRQADCMANGLEGRDLTHVLDVPGEDFAITATYSTDYDVDSWKITDIKTLDIEFRVTPKPGEQSSELPIPQTVLLENLHADATVKSRKAATNGLASDSFDDHLHAGDQPGFLVTEQYPYREQFVVGGYNDTLTSSWGSYANGYGSWEEEEKRLTEQNLVDNGAYGQNFSMVADLLVKNPDEPYFHKTIVDDSFIVPLAGKDC